MFKKPMNLGPFRERRHILTKYKCWVIDVEFFTVKGAAPIPLSLSVREILTDKVVVTTNVDYNSMPLQDLDDAVRQHQVRYSTRKVSSFHRKEYATRHYNDSKTNRMSLAMIGDVLRDAGFDPFTHRIFSW